MPIGILLADSDALAMLGAAGLLDAALAVMGVVKSDVRKLAALPFQLQRGANFKKRYSDGAPAAALLATETIQVVVTEPDIGVLARLKDVTDIDGGEAVLLALLAEDAALYLTTGDNRPIRAFGTANGIDDL